MEGVVAILMDCTKPLKQKGCVLIQDEIKISSIITKNLSSVQEIVWYDGTGKTEEEEFREISYHSCYSNP